MIDILFSLVVAAAVVLLPLAFEMIVGIPENW